MRGPRITCWGDPVWAGGAVGREDDVPWPLVVAGPPAIRSAIEAFSSMISREKGWGCLSASSRAQRMALLVCLERRTAGCGSVLADAERRRCRLNDDSRTVDASSGSSLRSWESCRRRGLKTCSGRPGSAGPPAVEKRGRGLKPRVAASRWIRRGVGDSDGRGLGLAEKRGVRRRARWEDGVGDLSSCWGVMVSCRRGSVRRWRWVGVIGS